MYTRDIHMIHMIPLGVLRETKKMPTATIQVVRGDRNSHLRKAHGAQPQKTRVSRNMAHKQLRNGSAKNPTASRHSGCPTSVITKWDAR